MFHNVANRWDGYEIGTVFEVKKEIPVDEYQMIVDPVALGKGRSMFDGIKAPLNLKLAKTRTFANGKVYLCYEPMA